MSNTRDIAVLCNNRMAFAAIQALYSLNRLHTIAIPEGNEDVHAFCAGFTAQTGIDFIVLKKEKLADQLQKLTENSALKYIFSMTFPWKIPVEIIKSAPDLFYNFHYGLLPEMRGADPVFECIRQQKKQSGITVHAIEEKIDTGAIVLKKTIPLETATTHGLLCTNLSYLGAHLLPELLVLLQNKSKGIVQDETKTNYYKKPTAADVCIQWEHQDAKSIEALVRACNPWNKGAYTQWNGWNIRILEVSETDRINEHLQLPGTILEINETKGLVIQCYNNTHLRINTVYTEEGFMSGHKLLAFGMKNGEQFASL